MARYEAGETLASIARTYDCSPPAISYVVSRSRTRQAGSEAAAKPPTAPELIKAAAASNGHAQPETGPAPADTGPLQSAFAPANGHAANGAGDPRTEPVPTHDRAKPGFDRPHANGAGLAANGDHRRTLHLSLGQPAARNGASDHLGESHGRPAEPAAAESAFSDRGAPARQAPPPYAPPHGNGHDAAAHRPSETPHAPRPEHTRAEQPESGRRREPGAFIDQELRDRVDADIAAFLAAFDAALAQDTQEHRAALREATDRLLRAGARTRIELERLEARLPLAAARPTGDAAWRLR